jgi:hypothetical protein
LCYFQEHRYGYKAKQAETAELIIESDLYEHFSEDENILQGDSDSDKDNVIDTKNG